MFAPEGFLPFATIASEIFMRAEDYYFEVILPAQREQTSQFRPSENSLAAKLALEQWLVDHCLFMQPVPIFAANEHGKAVRASHIVFAAHENLSRYDFPDPTDFDDEISLAISGPDPCQAVAERFFHAFVNRQTWCISALSDDEFSTRSKMLGPSARGIREQLRAIDGWALCVREEDAKSLIEIITGLTSVTETPTRKTKPGRPRKRNDAATIYRKMFPDGHEARGMTWKEVANEIERLSGKEAHVSTIQRGLRELEGEQ